MIETGARRREIDEVASELFHANGYAATSVRDIARALDIQGASLYAHVASKEDLLWAIVDRAATAFEQAADRAIAETDDGRRRRAPRRPRRGPRRGRHRRPGALERVRDRVAPPVGRSARRHRACAATPTRPASARRSTTASRVGAFRATDPAIAATFILTALNGIATWYRPDGRLSPDRIADHYVDLALRSLSEDHR